MTLANSINLSVLLLLYVYVDNHFVSCQFPLVCTNDPAAVQKKECCPNNCGGPTKGECANLPRGTHDEFMFEWDRDRKEIYIQQDDDRYNWPHCFFNRACRCKGNFYGYDCSECKWGWSGTDCSQKKTPVSRKNIKEMTKAAREHYFDTLVKAKNTPSDLSVVISVNCTNTPRFTNLSVYDTFVWMHYYSSRDTLLPEEKCPKNDPRPGHACNINDFAHEGSAFTTWHRHYLLFLERELQKLSGEADFSLPYWDWRDQGNICDICNDEFLGANDRDGFIKNSKWFRNWEMICWNLDEHYNEARICNGSYEGEIKRQPGTHPDVPSLPKKAEADLVLGIAAYDNYPHNLNSSRSFRNALEGFVNLDTLRNDNVAHLMHNQVHLFMGENSTMYVVPPASNDPIFIHHHCMVDFLIEIWLQKFKSVDKYRSVYPEEFAPIGHNLNEALVPFFPQVFNVDYFEYSSNLGYTFDTLDEEIGKEKSTTCAVSRIHSNYQTIILILAVIVFGPSITP